MKMVTLRIDDGVHGNYTVTLTGPDIGLSVQYMPPAGTEPPKLMPADIRKLFAQQPVRDLRAIAQQLGEWICPGPIREALDAEKAKGQPIRVALDVQAKSLQGLPWELMRSKRLPDFLDNSLPFVRLHSMRAPPPQVDWPLRVLLVVGAAINSDIQAEEEVFAIERTLHSKSHSIDREILRRPDMDSLVRKLESFRPHIFIFIGHCEFDAIQECPVLRFQDGVNSWDWSPEKLALDILHAAWRPSLVLLNACRTQNARAPFDFADAFIDAGVPACITMQGDVRGDLAGRFSAEVLQALFDGYPLDVAVARARHAIAGEKPLDVLDWALPVLSMAQPEVALFGDRPSHPLQDSRSFDDIQFFADRRDLRRMIRNHVLSTPAISGQGQLAVIAGDRQCGKTCLAKWCLQNFELMFNAIVRYVPIAGKDKVDFLTILRRMRDGLEGPCDAEESAFHAFHWTLNLILAGQVPTSWNGQPVADEGRVFDLNVVTYEQALRDIFASYLDALQKLSNERRVVIVIDQFLDQYRMPAIEPREFREVLVPYLLAPINQGKVPGVKIMLVAEQSDCRIFGIDALVPSSDWITVHTDITEPRDALIRELFWYPDPTLLSEIEEVVELYLQFNHAAGNGVSIGTIDRVRKAVVAMRFGSDLVDMQLQLGVRQMG